MLESRPSDNLPFFIYDCFSSTRFGGNVGGFVLNAGDLSTDTMQNIAREINAPVTGFVTDRNDRDTTIRFFMPGGEIAMCGHVTVGLYSHLVETEGLDTGAFTMNAQAGIVKVDVSMAPDGAPQVLMDVAPPQMLVPDISVNDLAGALGMEPGDIGALNPVEAANAGLSHLFVQLASLGAVQRLKPDFKKLTDVSNACGVHTVACFTMETENSDSTLHIRDFCPAVGADEVPASGTTNGALVGYLVRHGLIPDGTQSVIAEQGGELGRPSLIRCEIASANGVLTSVRVGGQAVANMKGTILGT